MSMADKGTSGIPLRELDPRDRYKLLCGVVVPRPIALVTTLDANGAVNAAPFSFFNVFSESPALIVLGLQHKPDHSPRTPPAISIATASSSFTWWTRRCRWR